MLQRTICWLILGALVGQSALLAEKLTIPFGTTVYCELQQQVTSRKKATSEGDLVSATVWKDVRVGDHVVIEAGTQVFVRVSKVKKAKIAGQKGKLELEAMNVTAVDGRDIPLEGGYDRSGRTRMGTSIALAAVVAWPLIFIKGKQAILEPGTVFDSIVRAPVEVEVPERANSRPILRIEPTLTAEVLYDRIDPEQKLKTLFFLLEGDEPIDAASIIEINGEVIQAMNLDLENPGENSVVGGTDFKALAKQFTRGMNRVTLQAGAETTEVLIEIEM